MLKLSDPLVQLYLKKLFIALVVLLLVIGTANHVINDFKEGLLAEEESKESVLRDIVRQVKFLRHQESIFLAYGDKYQYFIENGLVNKQDRVKWTDQLLVIQRALLLNPFKIQFEPEQKLTNEHVKHLKIAKDIFYYSRLNITAGMHSDLDVLVMFSKISENISPLYLVEGCDIKADVERLYKPIFMPNNALFSVKCSLILFQSKLSMFNLQDTTAEGEGSEEIDPADMY